MEEAEEKDMIAQDRLAWGPFPVWSRLECMRSPAERDVRLEVPVTGGEMELGGILGSGRFRLLVCFLGVFVCYFYYGILQETITRGKYGEGENQEKFRFAFSLVFVQCVVNSLFAKFLLHFFDSGKADRTRSWLYAACSLSYVGAMVSSNSALQYVNYPTQVLGKSCKPIPVMLLGVTLLKKKYPLTKYLCVLLIVLGVALFMYKPRNADVTGDTRVFGYGELLLLLSLTLDGLTGVSQDHMRAHYQTGSNQMMLHVNLWSSFVMGAGFYLYDSCSFRSINMFDYHNHPEILYHLGVRASLLQPDQRAAVGRNGPGVSGFGTRCQIWQRIQKGCPLTPQSRSLLNDVIRPHVLSNNIYISFLFFFYYQKCVAVTSFIDGTEYCFKQRSWNIKKTEKQQMLFVFSNYNASLSCFTDFLKVYLVSARHSYIIGVFFFSFLF
uniref:Solute carrier family 35 member B1 n=1 Tax=Leptobrachium leishanense TaxID=445787 RepID=A0A8C5Q4M5_9ANUR